MDKLLREARKMLKSAGVPHHIEEAAGHRAHHEIFVDGFLVLSISKGPGVGRNLNALRSILHKHRVAAP